MQRIEIVDGLVGGMRFARRFRERWAHLVRTAAVFWSSRLLLVHT